MTFDMTPRPLNPAAKAPEMTWPNGARSALFIGFDVDAETAWIGNNPSNVDRMVTTSHGGYDARVGIARILGLMDELGLKATFFTPGWTALAHRAECEAMVAAGHEIGHHGYLHTLPDRTRLDDAMEEIDRGFEALQSALGVRPVGYRAPSGENFPELLAYLKSQASAIPVPSGTTFCPTVTRQAVAFQARSKSLSTMRSTTGISA